MPKSSGFIHQLFDHLRGLPKCKQAFFDGSPRLSNDRPYAVLQDTVMQLYTLSSKTNFKTDITGLELVDALLADAHKRFQHGQCRVYIMAMDKPRLVPQRKLPEQIRRREQRQKQMDSLKAKGDEKKLKTLLEYSEKCVFTDKGIVDADAQCETLINLERLRQSGSMRQKIMDFIKEVLRRRIEKAFERPFPLNCTLVLDYDSSGPFVITNDKIVQRTDIQHHIGEGEFTSAFWGVVLSQEERPLDLILHCDDADTFVIGLNLVEQLRACGRLRGQVWWQSKTYGAQTDDDKKRNKMLPTKQQVKQPKGCAIDLTQLYEGIVYDLNWNARLVAHLWCFGGNDYVQKSQITNGMSFEDILRVVRDNKQHLKTLVYDYRHLEKAGEQIWLPPFAVIDNALTGERIGDAKKNLDGDAMDDSNMADEVEVEKLWFPEDDRKAGHSELMLDEIVAQLKSKSRRPSKNGKKAMEECADFDVAAAIRFAVSYWCINWAPVCVAFPFASNSLPC